MSIEFLAGVIGFVVAGARLGVDAEVRFLGDLAVGDFAIEAVMASDWLRIAELVSQ